MGDEFESGRAVLMTADGEILGEFPFESVEFDGGVTAPDDPPMDWGGSVEVELSHEDMLRLRALFHAVLARQRARFSRCRALHRLRRGRIKR